MRVYRGYLTVGGRQKARDVVRGGVGVGKPIAGAALARDGPQTLGSGGPAEEPVASAQLHSLEAPTFDAFSRGGFFWEFAGFRHGRGPVPGSARGAWGGAGSGRWACRRGRTWGRFHGAGRPARLEGDRASDWPPTISSNVARTGSAVQRPCNEKGGVIDDIIRLPLSRSGC